MKAGPDGLPLDAVKAYNTIVPDTVTDLNEREGFTFRKSSIFPNRLLLPAELWVQDTGWL
jgi:hypothetical protein